MVQHGGWTGAGGGGSSGSSGNNEDEIDASAPAIAAIEFTKNDGTQVNYEKKNGTYTNELTDGEITVTITYDKQVAVEDANWTVKGDKIIKKFTKSEKERVTVQNVSSGKKSSITVDVKIDTEYPKIIINETEVETDKIKIVEQTKERENLEEIPYNGETGRYTDKVKIKVTDDEVSEKEIVDAQHVKFTYEGAYIEFRNNIEVSKLGEYRIEVKDNVGNFVIYKFIITRDRENIEIDERKIKKIQKGDSKVNIVRITKDKKAIISSDPNSTRQTFEQEIKLNVSTDFSILNNGKKSEFETENGKDEADVRERIKTGMKLKIVDVEYDMVVAGDMDGDGCIEPRDVELAILILALNSLENKVSTTEGISIEEILFDVLDPDNLLQYIDQKPTFDLNGDGKIDEEDIIQIGDYNGDCKIDEDDIEAIAKVLDVNEDGTFDEKDQELIRYALDINDDGTFDELDINNMLVDGNISL